MYNMHELVKISLENEMDLILANKRSMKLGEFTGLSLSAQTTFATAVSEVARNTIESKRNGSLTLCIEINKRDKYIVARIKDNQPENEKYKEGLAYAKRLVNKYNVSSNDDETSIELFYYVAPPFKIDIKKLDEWRTLFRNEPPVSPYEELKRKNEQLQDLSEKIQKSESQYKTLTNSLPLTIFTLDNDGQLIYANEWLLSFTGLTIEKLNTTKWKTVVFEEDYNSFLLLLNNDITRGTITMKIQARLKNNISGDYLWHQVSISPLKNTGDEILYWIGYIVDIHAQKVFEETLKDNIELKHAQTQLKQNQQVLEDYITELNRSNSELQQFAFIASHDLQEPVRKLLYYSDYLLEAYKNTLDDKGIKYLATMHSAAIRMRELISDLLSFSQVNKESIIFKTVDLNKVIVDVKQDMELVIEEKKANLQVHNLPEITGDERMMHQLFSNLISNALKFSAKDIAPVIQVLSQEKDGYFEIEIRDNGIGFRTEHLPDIFKLFQRLHPKKDFEGTGLGLAICRKIVELHNGNIKAESAPGKGSSFKILLPVKQSESVHESENTFS